MTLRGPSLEAWQVNSVRFPIRSPFRQLKTGEWVLMRIVRLLDRPLHGACLVVALAVLSCGCGNSADDAASNGSTPTASTAAPSAVEALPVAVQELDINATEYSFKFSPDPAGGVKPGWTLLRFHNGGVEPHQVMFARVKDGVNMSELAAAGANDSSGSGAIKFVDMLGGVSYIGANQDTTALVKLPEGVVLAMCYVPDAKGVAHALMGMTTTLKVESPADVATTSTPAITPQDVLGTIELSKEGYRLPDHIGRGWYHVRNTDSTLHELSMLRLGSSIGDDQARKLVEDLAANKTTDVKVAAVGGMGAVSAGFDGYLLLDLAAGDYLAVDFMPEPGRPRPHMLDGYFGRFSV